MYIKKNIKKNTMNQKFRRLIWSSDIEEIFTLYKNSFCHTDQIYIYANKIKG